MKRNHILYFLLSAALLLSGCTTRQNQNNGTDQSNHSASEVSSESDNISSNSATDNTTDSAADNTSQIISADEAESIALSHAGFTKEQVTITENKLDKEDGRQIYEIEFYTEDNKEYDYEIDALTKDIIEADNH